MSHIDCKSSDEILFKAKLLEMRKEYPAKIDSRSHALTYSRARLAGASFHSTKIRGSLVSKDIVWVILIDRLYYI